MNTKHSDDVDKGPKFDRQIHVQILCRAGIARRFFVGIFYNQINVFTFDYFYNQILMYSHLSIFPFFRCTLKT